MDILAQATKGSRLRNRCSGFYFFLRKLIDAWFCRPVGIIHGEVRGGSELEKAQPCWALIGLAAGMQVTELCAMDNCGVIWVLR